MAEKKKEREGICQGIETVRRAILRNSNPDFGPERGQGTRSGSMFETMLRLLSPLPPLELPLPSTLLSHSFSLRLSSGLVREPSHSQKTQNADGHVSRRHQSAAGERAWRMRERKVRMCVCVCVCCGAKRFTALYSCRSSSRYAKEWMRRFSLFRHRPHLRIRVHRVNNIKNKILVMKLKFRNINFYFFISLLKNCVFLIPFSPR